MSELIGRYAAQGTPLRAVMMTRLGPNVWHDTPAQAMAVLEELEETARLWVLARPKPQPLSPGDPGTAGGLRGALVKPFLRRMQGEPHCPRSTPPHRIVRSPHRRSAR